MFRSDLSITSLSDLSNNRFKLNRNSQFQTTDVLMHLESQQHFQVFTVIADIFVYSKSYLIFSIIHNYSYMFYYCQLFTILSIILCYIYYFLFFQSLLLFSVTFSSAMVLKQIEINL